MPNKIAGIETPECLALIGVDQSLGQELEGYSDEFWHKATELFSDFISGHDMSRSLGEYEPVGFYAPLFSETVEFIDKQAFPFLDSLSRLLMLQQKALVLGTIPLAEHRRAKKFFNELGKVHADAVEHILKLIFSNPHISGNCGRLVTVYQEHPEVKPILEEAVIWQRRPSKKRALIAMRQLKDVLIVAQDDDYSRVPEDLKPDLELALSLWEKAEGRDNDFRQIIESVVEQIEQFIKQSTEQAAPYAKLAPAELNGILHDLGTEVIDKTGRYNVSSREMRDEKLSALKQDLVQKYPKKDVSDFLGLLKLIKDTGKAQASQLLNELEEIINFETDIHRVLTEVSERSAKRLSATQLGRIDELRKRLHLVKTVQWVQNNWPEIRGLIRMHFPAERQKIDDLILLMKGL